MILNTHLEDDDDKKEFKQSKIEESEDNGKQFRIIRIILLHTNF